MSFIKRFLRLRKQDDRVKIILMLGIVAVISFVLVIRNIIALYSCINTPVEYELTGNLTSDIRLAEVSGLDNVKAVSLQKQSSIQIKYKTREAYISCVFLSEQYARNVFGIEPSGNTTTFYMNRTAFDQILKEMELSGYNTDTGIYEQNGLQIEYTGDGGKYSYGKIILALEKSTDVIPDDTPMVFSILDNASLRSEADSLRIYVDKQDMEQMIVREIEQLGYSVASKEQLIEFENRLDILFLKIKYEAVICLMSILWIITLHKYRKK